jgi:hypothetical protein
VSLVLTTGGLTQSSPATATTISVQPQGSYTGANDDDCTFRCAFYYGYSVVTENITSYFTPSGCPSSGSYQRTITVDSDRTFKRRAYGEETGSGAFDFGDIVSSKTNAMVATASTPTSSSVTSSTATIECDYFPNTYDSTCTVKLQYRAFGSGTWTDAGSSDTGKSGYAELNISRSLTGLSASTTYEFRLDIVRTTNNDTTLNSSTATFTTSAAAPSITTNPATSIGPNSATLNGVINPNGISSMVYFEYGLTTSYGTTVGLQGPSGAGSSDIAFSANPTGLTASTLYHFRAVADPVAAGSNVNGSDATFTTSADPSAEALEQGPMPLVYNYDAYYGVERAFTFFVESPAATSSNRLLDAAVPWVAGDVKVNKDGGTRANVTNLPTRIGSTPEYTITLTASELSAENIMVTLIDADGPSWRDTVLHVRTKQKLGQLLIDSTQLGSNNPGMSVTGVGTSPGILATGGSTSAGDITGTLTSHVVRRSTAQAGAAGTITLDASASATNDYYNGCMVAIISGTGAGQVRFITDYVGATKVANVNRSWSTNPNSNSVFQVLRFESIWDLSPLIELSAIPTATSSFGLLVNALFQRFFYKRTQTATTQTLYKADSSTSLGTASVSDDGTTQTSGKIS